jgi:hypothetical protein
LTDLLFLRTASLLKEAGIMEDRMDEILEELFCTECEDIAGIGDVEVPDMGEMLTRVKSAAQAESGLIKPSFGRYKGKRMLARTAYILGIMVFSVILSMAYDLPSVKAFKFNVVRTFIYAKDDIITIFSTDKNTDPASLDRSRKDEIIRKLELDHTKKLPFHVLTPTYLPPAYTLDEAVWTEYPYGLNKTEQVYRDGNKGILQIIQEGKLTSVDEKMNISPD